MSDKEGDEDKIPEDGFHRKAVLIGVVDGDTLDVEIDLGWSIKLKERLRLEFVDTPEINKTEENKAGKWVKEQVEKWLELKEGKTTTELIITSEAYDRTGKVRGKYGRTLAQVYHLEEKWSLNDRLLTENMAWRTDEKGKLLEKRSLSLLVGIPKKLR